MIMVKSKYGKLEKIIKINYSLAKSAKILF